MSSPQKIPAKASYSCAKANKYAACSASVSITFLKTNTVLNTTTFSKAGYKMLIFRARRSRRTHNPVKLCFSIKEIK